MRQTTAHTSAVPNWGGQYERSVLSQLVPHLRGLGYDIRHGLRDEEVLGIEETYGFRFPPDLRQCLQYALPVGRGFPDWRGDRSLLLERLQWPEEGVCFDIENSAHWECEWGIKPGSVAESVEVARSFISRRPPLIPIFSHRYLPSVPTEEGNPVLSFYQTDVIYYGFNLSHYFHHEFGVRAPGPIPVTPKDVPFWGHYIS